MYKKIQALRKAKNWTQSDLADKVGVHKASINRLEKAVYLPSLDLLKKLCQVLDCSADYLLFDNEEKYETQAMISKFSMLKPEERKIALEMLDAWIFNKSGRKS